MAKLTISSSDMSRGVPVPEGWYKGKLSSFEQKINSKKDGYNLIPTVEFVGPDGAERKIMTWFSNKALGLDFARFYCAATDQKFDPAVDLNLDTEEIKPGVEIWFHASQDVYNGRIVNKMDNFLPGSEEVPF